MVALIFVEVNGFKTSKVLSNLSHLSPSKGKKKSGVRKSSAESS